MNDKDEVTIYYWKPNEKGAAGHVALQTHRGGTGNKGHYVSFYPATKCCLLSRQTKPSTFNTLPLPDDCHSCYIQVANEDGVLYYTDRTDKSIKKLSISDDKKAIFKEQMLGITKNRPLNNENLQKIKSLTNHIARCGVKLYKGDITRKGVFHTRYDEDMTAAEYRAPSVIRLYTLNVDKINSAYETFAKSGYDWNLLENGEGRNCSGLAAFLLEKGDINNLFSFWDKIKTGLITGAALGGLAGGITGGIVAAATTATVTPFLPIVGGIILLFGCIAVPVALVLAIGAGVLAGAAIGTAVGAAAGATGEYIYTELLGKTLVTPKDIFRLAHLAEYAERDINKFIFSRQCRALIDRCTSYSSKMKIKKDAISRLKSLLNSRLADEISSITVQNHVRSFLRSPNHPIFEASFFRTSTVKSIFKDCLQLMNTDSQQSAAASSSKPPVQIEENDSDDDTDGSNMTLTAPLPKKTTPVLANTAKASGSGSTPPSVVSQTTVPVSVATSAAAQNKTNPLQPAQTKVSVPAPSSTATQNKTNPSQTAQTAKSGAAIIPPTAAGRGPIVSQTRSPTAASTTSASSHTSQRMSALPQQAVTTGAPATTAGRGVATSRITSARPTSAASTASGQPQKMSQLRPQSATKSTPITSAATRGLTLSGVALQTAVSVAPTSSYRSQQMNVLHPQCTKITSTLFEPAKQIQVQRQPVGEYIPRPQQRIQEQTRKIAQP